jgi:hypothetical protein
MSYVGIDVYLPGYEYVLTWEELCSYEELQMERRDIRSR